MADRSAKVNVEFGLSPTDEVVKAWLTEHGIDHSLVLAYRITRGTSDLPTIELTMFYSEKRETA